MSRTFYHLFTVLGLGLAQPAHAGGPNHRPMHSGLVEGAYGQRSEVVFQGHTEPLTVGLPTATAELSPDQDAEALARYIPARWYDSLFRWFAHLF